MRYRTLAKGGHEKSLLLERSHWPSCDKVESAKMDSCISQVRSCAPQMRSRDGRIINHWQRSYLHLFRDREIQGCTYLRFNEVIAAPYDIICSTIWYILYWVSKNYSICQTGKSRNFLLSCNLMCQLKIRLTKTLILISNLIGCKNSFEIFMITRVQVDKYSFW